MSNDFLTYRITSYNVCYTKLLRILEALYRRRKLNRGPRIVAVGGGTGLSMLLKGVKKITNNITAIVTVGDDGGSSGRLREEMGILPPGDISVITSYSIHYTKLYEKVRYERPRRCTTSKV